MHKTQEKLLKLAEEKNLGNMTLREIGELIDEGEYPQKIKHHIEQLKKKGLLREDKNKGIIYRIKSGKVKGTSLVAVPILGSANCGEAVNFADERIEGYLRISPRLLVKKNIKDLFALKAEGPSMNETDINGKNIEDGDYVIVDSSERNPENGEVVLSIIDDMANIKEFIWDKENDQIILNSESTKDFPPIYIHEKDNFMINGKVIQVIKRPKNKEE